MFLKLEEETLIENMEIKNFGLRKKLVMKIKELREEKQKKIDDLDECLESDELEN